MAISLALFTSLSQAAGFSGGPIPNTLLAQMETLPTQFSHVLHAEASSVMSTIKANMKTIAHVAYEVAKADDSASMTPEQRALEQQRLLAEEQQRQTQTMTNHKRATMANMARRQQAQLSIQQLTQQHQVANEAVNDVTRQPRLIEAFKDHLKPQPGGRYQLSDSDELRDELIKRQRFGASPAA